MKIAVKDGYVVGVAYKGDISAIDGITYDAPDDTQVNVGDAWPPTTDVGNGNPPPPPA